MVDGSDGGDFGHEGFGHDGFGHGDLGHGDFGHEGFEHSDFGHGQGHGQGDDWAHLHADGRFSDFEFGFQSKMICGGRWVSLPGIAIAPHLVRALAWPHGTISRSNPDRRLNQRAELRKLLENAGLVDVGYKIRNATPADQVHTQLIGPTAMGMPVRTNFRSNAWYPGATGLTRVWQDHFMIGTKQWFGPREAESRDLDRGVYLRLDGVTWQFDQTADCETYVAILVKYRQAWNKSTGSWGKAETAIADHRDAAVSILRQWLKLVEGFPASDLGLQQRQLLLSLPYCEPERVPPPATVNRETLKVTDLAPTLEPEPAPTTDGIDSFSYPK